MNIDLKNIKKQIAGKSTQYREVDDWLDTSNQEDNLVQYDHSFTFDDTLGFLAEKNKSQMQEALANQNSLRRTDIGFFKPFARKLGSRK